MSTNDDLDHLVLAEDEASYCLGDEVRDQAGVLLGRVDRVVVTPELRSLTHLGVQPGAHWKWPRLVPIDDLGTTSVSTRTHVVAAAGRWPACYPTADLLPGVPEDELPDHPIIPTSGVQRFLLSLATPGTGGPLSIAATMRDRVPVGETTLRPGTHLVESARYSLSTLGVVVGIIAEMRTNAVRQLLVQHRHGLRHRVARLPVDMVREAGVGQVTTLATRGELSGYDIPAVR